MNLIVWNMSRLLTEVTITQFLHVIQVGLICGYFLKSTIPATMMRIKAKLTQVASYSLILLVAVNYILWGISYCYNAGYVQEAVLKIQLVIQGSWSRLQHQLFVSWNTHTISA
jgi:hypothetical protein